MQRPTCGQKVDTEYRGKWRVWNIDLLNEQENPDSFLKFSKDNVFDHVFFYEIINYMEMLDLDTYSAKSESIMD